MLACAADDSCGQGVVQAIRVPNCIHPLANLQVCTASQGDRLQPLLHMPHWDEFTRRQTVSGDLEHQQTG